MSRTSCLVALLLVAHASAYIAPSSSEELDPSTDECSTWCTCTYGLTQRPALRYCCPSGEPDPDICTTINGNDVALTEDSIPIVRPPEDNDIISTRTGTHSVNCNQPCYPSRAVNICRTRLGATLVQCRSSGYVNGGCHTNCHYTDGCCCDQSPNGPLWNSLVRCRSGGYINGGCQHYHSSRIGRNCQYTYGCNDCCDQLPTGNGPIMNPNPGRDDLRVAVISAASRYYPTRGHFVQHLEHILTNQASYSWVGEEEDFLIGDGRSDDDIYNIGDGQEVVRSPPSTTPAAETTAKESAEKTSSEDDYVDEVKSTTSSYSLW